MIFMIVTRFSNIKLKRQTLSDTVLKWNIFHGQKSKIIPQVVLKDLVANKVNTEKDIRIKNP